MEKKTKTSRKTEKKEVVVPTPTPAPVVVPPPVSVPVVVSPVKEKKVSVPHLPLSKENLVVEFDNLIAYVNEQVSKLAEDKKTQKGSRALKSVSKKLNLLKNRTQRVIKLKKKKVVDPSLPKSNNGFMKPVRLSPELLRFTGWDDKPVLRADVTKFVSDYVKTNKLNNVMVVVKDKDGNPVKDKDGNVLRKRDGRIINPDTKIRSLLSKDYVVSESSPLTYFSIQGHLKFHYLPVEKSV